jgi:predicted PurR-regulated permease PerM
MLPARPVGKIAAGMNDKEQERPDQPEPRIQELPGEPAPPDEVQGPPKQPGPPVEELPGEPAPPDEEPLKPPPSVPPARVEPVVVPRWMQLVLLTVALLGLSALVRASRPVLLIFIVSAVIALIINPLVRLLQQAGFPRGLAIAAVYVGMWGGFAGSIALLVNPVAEQLAAFQRDLPGLIDSANSSLANLQRWLDGRGIGIQIQRPGETALETFSGSVLRGSGDVVSFTQDLVTIVIEAGFALVLIVVISIYMLLYGEQIGALVRRAMPPGDGTPEDDYPTRVQKAVFGFVRGQLTFSLIMGLSAGVALWVFGVLGIFPAGQTYAIFFGAFYGLMELVPYVGPVLGAAPPVLVALFQGEPLTALWLVLLFLALQQLEGHVVAPMVFGHHLRINPLLVIFVLLLGGHLQGIVGALVALPMAAIVRETAVYLQRHLVLEPWGTPTVQDLREEASEEPTAVLLPGDERCRACGAVTKPGAAFCAACGRPLGLRVTRPDVRVPPRRWLHAPAGRVRRALRLRR